MSPLSPFAQLLIGISSALLVLPPIDAAEESAVSTGTPVTIRIEVEDRAELEQLIRLVSIDDVRGHEVWAVVTPSQLEKLEAE